MQSLFQRIQKAKILFFRKMIEKSGGFDMAKAKPAPSLLTKIGMRLRSLLIPPDPLEPYICGPICFEILHTSCQLGIFELLDKTPGKTLPEIAKSLHLEIYPTKILLLGLVCMKLLHKIGDEYYNDPFLSPAFLTSSNQGFCIHSIEYMHHFFMPAMSYLLDSVKENRPVALSEMFGKEATNYYQELAKDSTKNQYFEKFMRLWTQINQERVAALPFFSGKKILDVGGNTGSLARAIVSRHPTASVTVYDLPEVIEETKKHFQSHEASSRLSTLGGNILNDSFPTGYDVVLFSHFIDIFSEETVQNLLQKVWQSLPSEGIVSIFTPILYDEENGPLNHGVLGAYFLCLANGVGRFYSVAEITSWLHKMGFRSVQKYLLPCDEAVVVGKK